MAKTAEVKTKPDTTKGKSKKVRQLPKPEYKSFKLHKKIKKPHQPLPKARVLFKESLLHLWRYKKTFVGITAVYLVLMVLLVKGLSTSGDVNQVKQVLQENLSGFTGQITTGITLFGYLLGGSTGATTEASGIYQLIVVLLSSLAIIWALRQTMAGTKVGIRESFYRGMYPLIPFFFVLIVIGLQCLPLAIGSWLFSVTVMSGLAVTAIEQVLWSIMCGLLVLLTIYLVSSSLFALYIATLPDMTPMKALRSARELVRYRRWEIIRKVVFLPFILLVLGAVIFIPVILVIAPAAEWLFFVLSSVVLAVAHGYMYSLYRKLL